jgi:hypothetical protein
MSLRSCSAVQMSRRRDKRLRGQKGNTWKWTVRGIAPQLKKCI